MKTKLDLAESPTFYDLLIISIQKTNWQFVSGLYLKQAFNQGLAFISEVQ